MRFLKGLLAAAAIGLARCGGNGDAPPAATVMVTIRGLPAGAGADVVLTGPSNTTRSLTTSGTQANLPPGVYTLTANSVLSGSTVHAPQQASQTFALLAG